MNSAIENALASITTAASAAPVPTPNAIPGRSTSFAAICASHLASLANADKTPGQNAAARTPLGLAAGKAATAVSQMAKDSGRRSSPGATNLADFSLPPLVAVIPTEAVSPSLEVGSSPTFSVPLTNAMPSSSASVIPVSPSAPGPIQTGVSTDSASPAAQTRVQTAFGLDSQNELSGPIPAVAPNDGAIAPTTNALSSPGILAVSSAASAAATVLNPVANDGAFRAPASPNAEMAPADEQLLAQATVPKAASPAVTPPNAAAADLLPTLLGQATFSSALASASATPVAAGSETPTIVPGANPLGANHGATQPAAASPDTRGVSLPANADPETRGNNNATDLATLVAAAFAPPVKPPTDELKPNAAPRLSPVAATGNAGTDSVGEFLSALQTSVTRTLNLFSSELHLSAAAPQVAGSHPPAAAAANFSSPTAGTPSGNVPNSYASSSSNTGTNSQAATPSSNPVPSSASTSSASANKAGTGTASNGNSSDQSSHKSSPSSAMESADLQTALPQAAAALTDPAGASAGGATQANSGQPTPAASPSTQKSDGDVSADGAHLPQNLPSVAESQAPAIGPVQTAQMVSKAAQSEMRIGLNTAAFGSVEVRTVVRANDVGVLIGSERGDLRSLLANELPGVAQNLQQQNLRLAQVNFHHDFASSNNLSSGGGGSQPRSFAAKSAAGSSVAPAEMPSGESTDPAEAAGVIRGAGSLSILA